MTSPIAQLSQLIVQGVATLETLSSEKGFKLPRLDEPFTESSEKFRLDSCAAEAANLIVAAALQLVATVLPPVRSISNVPFGALKAGALQVCLQLNIPEILREAGPRGLHVDQISEATNVDGKKLGRILRYLANEHIFREISPDVFANNRISSFIDSGKSFKELQVMPETKHDGSRSFAAMTEFQLDVVHKSAYFTLETLTDPITKLSGEPNHSPFNKAFQTTKPLFEWFEEPEQNKTRHLFGLAMLAATANESPDGVLTGFDWKGLPQGAVVVDLGGGVGSSVLSLATQFQHLKLVVQDRAPVIEQAHKVWESKMPEALKSGRVKLEAHDFFTPQPTKNTSVFMLKHIVHNWSDKYASKILIRLREAAAPDTKLLLLDPIIPYTCKNVNAGYIPGALPKEAPAPLLPNYGGANNYQYATDVIMFILCNSQERTLEHLSALLLSTGWRIVRADRSYNSDGYQAIEAVPV